MENAMVILEERMDNTNELIATAADNKNSKYLRAAVPELTKLLNNAPAYGACGLELHFQDSQLVGISIKTEIRYSIGPGKDGTFTGGLYTENTKNTMYEKSTKNAKHPRRHKEYRSPRQELLLELLREAVPKSLKASEIAKAMGLSISSVGHLLQKLQEKDKVKVDQQYGYWKLWDSDQNEKVQSVQSLIEEPQNE
jgi:DNA-binding transcriptional ArsR family regulator